MKRPYIILLLIALLTIPDFSSEAKPVTKPISFIRDDETEKFLQDISASIFKAGGLDPEAVKIVIINDNAINAFVTGGQKLFVHTGLITQAGDIGGLMGVIAHETGHIKGAHIIQKGQNIKEASIGSIAGYVLGLGSVLAGAPPEAGVAIGSAGQNVAMRGFLSYSRDYENAADTVALSILKKIGINPRGLVDILKQLQQKQKIAGDIQDEYLLTHPVTEERVNYILSFLTQHPELDKPAPAVLEAGFRRVKAKVMGFLEPPERTRLYYSGQNGVDAIYARAIAFHKEAKFAESLALVDGLINSNPEDPYFTELKAQFLFEQGEIDASIAQYRKALSLLGNSVLVRLKLAEALLATKDIKKWQEATGQLKAALITEPRNPGLLEKLGIAYGKMNQLSRSYLYLAESAIASQNIPNARRYMALAEYSADKKPEDSAKIAELKKELDRLLDKE